MSFVQEQSPENYDTQTVGIPCENNGMTPEIHARASVLAKAHWDGYTGPLIKLTMALTMMTLPGGRLEVSRDALLTLLKENYLMAAVHFFKHGVEWCEAGYNSAQNSDRAELVE